MENSRRGAVSSFTHREYADMYLIYGETRKVSTRGIVSLNARLAARLYAERYPDRMSNPTYEVIERLDSAYREGRIPGARGSQSGRPRTIEDDVVLQEREEDPSTSVRMIQSRTGIPKSSVHRILKKKVSISPIPHSKSANSP
ncbi:unnamed protein product [Parnassius apollo]|uniref:(apollo) hypothetical protein n=1 Tax=Parnassius apollo TaxID=110799 RepID=A0A8S3WWW9_PARAO|nr:unnamed protein product [Parnassius apollo]